MDRWRAVRSRLSAWHSTWPGAVRWVLPLTWMGLIYLISAQPTLPSAPSPLWDVLLKKGAHMAEYAVLTLLLWQAMGGARPGVAWVLAVAYAATDELHQTTVPGRHGTHVDVIVDAAGALLAAIALWRDTRSLR